jgi:ABC-type proline/glycine betaine transport system permease subunit
MARLRVSGAMTMRLARAMSPILDGIEQEVMVNLLMVLQKN